MEQPLLGCSVPMLSSRQPNGVFTDIPQVEHWSLLSLILISDISR